LQQQVVELAEAAEAALQRVAELEAMSPFPRRELLPSPRRTSAIVVWKPRSQQ
jgi:MerR family transcriptional regulator/heat shock protein HspR